MLIQLFNSDFEAFLYLMALLILLLIINRIVSLLIEKNKKISKKQKIIVSFSLRLITAAVLLYLLLEGFPFMKNITNEYPAEVAIFTASLSTALAFASSGIFSNLISGIVLFSLKPFEIGDIIKIDGEIGIVRSVKLTTTVIETFDNIIVEKANTDVISSSILNYTINVSEIKSFVDFKKELHYTNELIAPANKEKFEEIEHSRFKSRMKRQKREKIHNFIFQMEFPYQEFHRLINEVEKICTTYTDYFGFKPRYHISDVKNKIVVMFRILTFDASQIFNYQPQFAKEIYELIFDKYIQK
ncbi:MAG: mechanosensitive ion channel domain-containing protein [Promethearchaeia archaeon]